MGGRVLPPDYAGAEAGRGGGRGAAAEEGAAEAAEEGRAEAGPLRRPLAGCRPGISESRAGQPFREPGDRWQRLPAPCAPCAASRPEAATRPVNREQASL